MKISIYVAFILVALPTLYICYGMLTDFHRPLRYVIPAVLASLLVMVLLFTGAIWI